MRNPLSDKVISAQTLLGRPVFESDGRKVGRLHEIELERIGDDLCASALLVGPRAWLTRFGWTTHAHGQRIAIEDVAEFSPHIRLRPLSEA